jgi:hypothetical protein
MNLSASELRTVAASDLLNWTSRRFVEQSPLSSHVKILGVKELKLVRPIGRCP